MHCETSVRTVLCLLITLFVGSRLMAQKHDNPLSGQPFESIDDLFNKVSVSDIIELADGRLLLAFGPGAKGAYSQDRGKTWGDPFDMRDAEGAEVAPGLGDLLLMKSGALGLYWFSDYHFNFRVSRNQGKTWTAPISMAPWGAHAYGAANDRGIVLETGRIVIPAAWRMDGPRSPEDGDNPLGSDIEETLCYSFSLYSDDEGLTWKRSRNVIFTVLDGRYPSYPGNVSARGKSGFSNFEEPSVVELANGDLMMCGRNPLGRLFVSHSVTTPKPWQQTNHVYWYTDVEPDPAGGAGVVWRQPVPTPLAAARAPSELKYIPALKAILCIWNQASVEEIVKGYSRHRLSTALSFDDGNTWKHFKNLDSLDDVAYIEPPALEDLHGVYGFHYKYPTDTKRYHGIGKGSLRTCYPQTRVLPDVVIIQYNYGHTGDAIGALTTKTRVLPIAWFTD